LEAAFTASEGLRRRSTESRKCPVIRLRYAWEIKLIRSFLLFLTKYRPIVSRELHRFRWHRPRQSMALLVRNA